MIKELIYVTHTCKKCDKAFMDKDRNDAQNYPPTCRVCPECKKSKK